jgi:hypothetical protein
MSSEPPQRTAFFHHIAGKQTHAPVMPVSASVRFFKLRLPDGPTSQGLAGARFSCGATSRRRARFTMALRVVFYCVASVFAAINRLSGNSTGGFMGWVPLGMGGSM